MRPPGVTTLAPATTIVSDQHDNFAAPTLARPIPGREFIVLRIKKILVILQLLIFTTGSRVRRMNRHRGGASFTIILTSTELPMSIVLLTAITAVRHTPVSFAKITGTKILARLKMLTTLHIAQSRFRIHRTRFGTVDMSWVTSTNTWELRLGRNRFRHLRFGANWFRRVIDILLDKRRLRSRPGLNRFSRLRSRPRLSRFGRQLRGL